jgi:hypothetical protein
MVIYIEDGFALQGEMDGLPLILTSGCYFVPVPQTNMSQVTGALDMQSYSTGGHILDAGSKLYAPGNFQGHRSLYAFL